MLELGGCESGVLFDRLPEGIELTIKGIGIGILGAERRQIMAFQLLLIFIWGDVRISRK